MMGAITAGCEGECSFRVFAVTFGRAACIAFPWRSRRTKRFRVAQVETLGWGRQSPLRTRQSTNNRGGVKYVGARGHIQRFVRQVAEAISHAKPARDHAREMLLRHSISVASAALNAKKA